MGMFLFHGCNLQFAVFQENLPHIQGANFLNPKTVPKVPVARETLALHGRKIKGKQYDMVYIGLPFLIFL